MSSVLTPTRLSLSLSKASLLESRCPKKREGFDKLSPNRLWGTEVAY